MKKILFGLIGLAALGAGLALATAVPTTETTPSAATMSDGMKDATRAATPYVTYTKAAFDAAAGKQRVLFFAASWCPNCRAADKDINAKLKTIPGAVVIFKTDYDTETALKTKYGITHQHTFVYVDKAGKALKTWAGGGTAEILANVKATTR
ncbi:thioredoxin family protein [Deinococcus sp.]|uniref:TlpA family protein disulfide reductase n=1 Tax=Deinococcus sp. TaxID=47478 RepID=UPI0025F142CB|nr:thioredoxin family protein [Deinococcus sp.]